MTPTGPNMLILFSGYCAGKIFCINILHDACLTVNVQLLMMHESPKHDTKLFTYSTFVQKVVLTETNTIEDITKYYAIIITARIFSRG
jgi:hypothetical protein